MQLELLEDYLRVMFLQKNIIKEEREKMKKILVIFSIIAIISLAGCTANEANKEANGASEYPKRAIEMVIPFGEGGASDTFARKFAEIMNESLPKPIQPVNQKGSGGLVGMTYAFQQANDGYTVLEITPSHVIADVMEVSQDIKLLEDFEPLTRIQSDTYVISVPKSSEYKTFEEIVKAGKTKEIKFAGISPGGLDDLTLNALAKETGINIKFVPYASGSEVKAAVLGGEVDIYLDKLVSAIGYIKSGDVKPVVVLNDERISSIDELKDVPSTVELGYDVTIGSWRGFVIKKGAPQEVKDYLISEMKKAYDTQEYKDFAETTLTNIRPGFLNNEEFGEFMQSQYKMFDEVAKNVGLK